MMRLHLFCSLLEAEDAGPMLPYCACNAVVQPVDLVIGTNVVFQQEQLTAHTARLFYRPVDN